MFSFHDVTFGNVLWRQCLFQQKRWDGGGGWVHLKGVNSIATSGFGYRYNLAGGRGGGGGGGWGHFCHFGINEVRNEQCYLL